MLALMQSKPEDSEDMRDTPPADFAIPEEKEMTLAEKIALAVAAGNTSLLTRLLAIKAEDDSRLLFPTDLDWEKQLNTWAEEELHKMGFASNSLRYRVFVHGEDDQEKKGWKVRDGVIVHVHYFGKAADTRDLRRDVFGKEYSPFWKSFRNVLRTIPKLQRSTSLEVRGLMLTRQLEATPKWKKILVNNEEKIFDLLHDRNCRTRIDITITKSHAKSGQTVTVSGDLSEQYDLEREALVLLSRKVAEFYASQEKEG